MIRTDCPCLDCKRNNAIAAAAAAPIHRPLWQDAEPANEQQAKAWGDIVDRALKDYGHVNMPTLVAIVLGECQVRQENYHRVGLQVERFIRESSNYELRQGKSGGVFKRSKTSGSNQTTKLESNCTCKTCGNTNLNTSEKSCWRCGALQ